MINDFFKNSAIYGVGKIISLILGVLLIPVITQALSPQQYGIFDLLNLCLVLLNLSVAMEISQAVVRYMIDAKNEDEKRDYVSTAFFFSLIMFTITAVGLYFFQAPLSNLIFNNVDYHQMIVYLIPWLYLRGINSFISNQFRWENKPKIQVMLQIFMGLSHFIFVLVFFQVITPSLELLIYAYLTSQSLTAVLGMGFILRNRIIHFSFSPVKLKYMILFSLPLVPSSIAVFAQTYIDRIMISQLLDLNALGIYALAFKIASLLYVFSNIFHLSITPLIYKHYKDKNSPQRFGEAARIYLFFILCSIIGICLFMPELFYLFIGEAFSEATMVIPWLLLAIAFQSFYVFAPGLAIAKKTNYIAILSIIGMIINIILNIIFINNFGFVGASIATFITAFVMCIINIFISQKYYFIIYNYKEIIIGVAITITILLLINIFNYKINVEIFIYKLIAYTAIILGLLNLFIPKYIRAFIFKK